MADEQNPTWHRMAKIGDEHLGRHIGFIFHQTDNYLIYSPQEDRNVIVTYYSDDKLRDYLDKLSVELSKLKTELHDTHPERPKYLRAVAQVYSLAFQNKTEEAKLAIQNILLQLHNDSNTQKKTQKPPYLLIAFIGLLVAIGLIFTYQSWYRHVSGLSALIYYIILVSFAIAVAALIYGLTGSFGNLEGEYWGVKYKFAGPIVAAILVVLGYFFLPKGGQEIEPEKSFTIKVLNNNNPVSKGEVKLIIAGLNLTALPISDGQAIFANLSKEKLQEPIDIVVRCPGYLPLLINDTNILNISSIKLNVVAAGKIKVSGRITDANEAPIADALVKVINGRDSAVSLSNGKYFLTVNEVTTGDPIILQVKAFGYNLKTTDVEPASEANLKDIALERSSSVSANKLPITPPLNRTIQLGSSYQGGIVFHLEKDRKHGLIAAEIDQGNDVAWWIRSSTITRNSYSMSDGFANSENIMAEQGNTGAYAALLCRNHTGGGFKDWFLPSINQLELLYKNKHLLKNLKAERYWSSTANGDNVWYLDFSNLIKNVDFPSTRYRVRAVREF